jgi:hypothetical protein
VQLELTQHVGLPARQPLGDPTPSAPTSSDGVITIQAGHAVTVTSGVTADQVVIPSGGPVADSMISGAGAFTLVGGGTLASGASGNI